MGDTIESGTPLTGDLKAFNHNDAPALPARILPLFSLNSRTAIVTGAGAGIGLAVARCFAEAGSNVIIWYHSNTAAVDRAAEIEDEFNVKCKAYRVDVTNANEVQEAVASQIKEFDNRLDVFVANAGVPWTQGPIINGSVEHFQQVVRTDFDGVFFCARAAGQIWEAQKRSSLASFSKGSFIATASMSGHIANTPQMQTAYNAAKAGVIHMCKSLAVEWAHCARVNTISPGYIATEISSFVPDATKNIWRDKVPLGREGMPSELAGGFLYLASDASTYTTGADLLIDGGYCAP